MARTAADRLRDIREGAIDLLGAVDGMTPEQFAALPKLDRLRFRAVKNALAELGEAAKAIERDVALRHEGVDWRGFGRLRDLVAHQYFGLDLRRLFVVIRDEVPRLLEAVEAELGGSRASGGP